MIDVHCPHCNRFLFRVAEASLGEVEIQCPRGGRRFRCRWKGIFTLSTSPFASSTLSPSQYRGALDASA